MSVQDQLGAQESRFLKQHADDPVQWRLWSAQTLELARAADKPLLLSIGYSACHWSRQMQQESFMDAAVAAQMNENFVCVLIDREERPDLDDIFQTAHQLLNGQPGGWPLTAFLCPKTQLPFVIGTYYPHQPMAGRIPFPDLLVRVNGFYRQQHRDMVNLREQLARSFNALNDLPESDPPVLADLYLLHEASRRLLEGADRVHGGFNGAPKFTMPFYLWRLLDTVAECGELASDAEQQLRLTLNRIGGSAIHDSVDGGFFRYTTDDNWRCPHFEKMLFDNAALVGIYAAAASILKAPVYGYVAQHTLNWLQRTMAVENGYAASMDATTGGGDGTAYYFNQQEIRAALSQAEYSFFNELYGLSRINRESFLLHCVRSPTDAAERLQLSVAQAQALFESANDKLRRLRCSKPQAERDDKVILSWNALTAKAMAQLARYSGDPQPVHMAQQLVDKLVARHWYNNRLFGIAYRNGERLPAFLDDYAFLLMALLDLMRVQWRDADYQVARRLAEGLLQHFQDDAQGGFFYVPHDYESLPFKPKPWADTMTPSGNGAAALALLRFGYLTAEPRYVTAARRCVDAAMPLLRRQPEAHHTLLQSLRELLLPKPVVLLLGDQAMAAWQSRLLARFQDQICCYRVPTASEFHPPEVMVMDANTAVVCLSEQVAEPVTDLDSLIQTLEVMLSPETVMEKTQ